MKAKKAAQVLGVNEGDDEATITAAFRTRAAQWHPDRNEGNRDEATRRFEEINRAFRALNQNGNTAGEAMDLSEMLLFFQFMMGGASQPTEDAAALSSPPPSVMRGQRACVRSRRECERRSAFKFMSTCRHRLR